MIFLTDDDGDLIVYYSCTRSYTYGALFDETPNIPLPGGPNVAEAFLNLGDLPDPEDDECNEDDEKVEKFRDLEFKSDDEINVVSCSCTGKLCNGATNLAKPGAAAVVASVLLFKLI